MLVLTFSTSTETTANATTTAAAAAATAAAILNARCTDAGRASNQPTAEASTAEPTGIMLSLLISGSYWVT